MANTFHVDIVTAESKIFSGKAEKLFVTGVDGELEILHNHAALLTSLAPGPVWVVNDKKEEGFVIFGGTLEVQPNATIILADTALRASDVDEAAAMEAKMSTEHALQTRAAEVDYTRARAELAKAVAQLRAIKQIRGSLKK